MTDRGARKSRTDLTPQRENGLAWILQPLVVFAPQPLIALGVLIEVLSGAVHLRYPLVALGFTLGLILCTPPALVWLRVADRINEKYRREPYRAVLNGSTVEQNVVTGTAFLCAFCFGLLNIWLNRQYAIPIGDPGLWLGGLVGAAIVADGVYLSWYRRRKARAGSSRS